MVSDLGSSFGTTGISRSLARSKGNFNSYARSKFVRRETGEDISFGTPSHPTFFLIIHPHDYFRRWHLLWIGRDIPRSDAKWLGKRLERLSPAQIRDAFRAAGYSPQQVEGFAGIVERRIAELRDL